MNILDIAIAKKLAGGGGGSGTDNYNDLSNLPKINDTTLSGNKSSSALGLQSEINSDSKLASDLVDDTNQDNKFVTSTEKNTWNGKQNAIDADHKINADYVDDSTSTNKFVTASDKETWNAKQNAIDNSHKLSSDLVDDANHTNKFVTSTEKNTWNGKQNAIDSEHKLSSSLVSFTTAEAAALASGIDSTKAAQISTNQSNILYALETGAANYAPLEGDNKSGSGYFLGATNSGMKVFTSGTVMHVYCEYTKTTNTQFSIQFTNASGNVIASTSLYAPSASASGTISGDVTLPQDVYGYNAYYNGASGNTCTITKVMICPKNVWDAIQKYVPYSVPNYDLTRLEAEDRASLAEVVDSGAKQLIPYDLSILKSNNTAGSWNNNVYTYNSVTFTVNSDNSISVNRSATGTTGVAFRLATNAAFSPGTYVLSAGSGTLPQDWTLSIDWSDNTHTYATSSTNPAIFTLTAAKTGNIYIWASAPSGSFTYKPMVCTKAAFGVSSKFVPYRPNYDLVLSQLSRIPFYVGQNGNDNYFGVIITGPNRGSYSIDFMSNNGVNGFGNIIVSAFYSNGAWNVHVNTDASYNVTMKVYSISSTSMAILFYASNKWAGFTISGGSTDQMTIYRSSTAPSWTEITQQAFPTT